MNEIRYTTPQDVHRLTHSIATRETVIAVESGSTTNSEIIVLHPVLRCAVGSLSIWLALACFLPGFRTRELSLLSCRERRSDAILGVGPELDRREAFVEPELDRREAWEP